MKSPLVHGQINMIKFVESNEFNNVYSKIWNIFAWSNFLKIWCVLIHQIHWMKNIKKRRKNEEKTTNYSTWNIFVAKFSFGALGSLIFVIYFVISSFTSTKTSSKHSGDILNLIISPLLNGIQRGKYTPNTWFRSSCSQIGGSF